MGFQDQLSLNAGQKYCRMLQREHSAILSTCIKLPHGFKTFVLSFFEWLLKTGFTVLVKLEVEDHGFERLGWYGHVKHSSIAVRTTCGIQVVRWHRPGRPEVTWKKINREQLPRPQGYKKKSCLTQLSAKFFLLINVKMPTIVSILTFISRIKQQLRV